MMTRSQAAKQEYNSSQMFHVMDEAIERGEQMAKEAKKNEPKTEEERREEAIKEANGTEDSEGMLSEILDEQLETISDDNGTDTLVISGKGMEYCKRYMLRNLKTRQKKRMQKI